MWQGFPEAPKHSSLVSMLLGSSTSPANVLTRLLTSCRYWVMVYVVCASRVLRWFGIFWGLYLNQIEAVDRWYLDVIIKHWGAGTRSISFPKEKKKLFFIFNKQKTKNESANKNESHTTDDRRRHICLNEEKLCKGNNLQAGQCECPCITHIYWLHVSIAQRFRTA